MRNSLAAAIALTAITLPGVVQAQMGVAPYQPQTGMPYRAPVPPTSPLQTLPNTLPGTVPPLINQAVPPPVGQMSVAANRVPSSFVRLPGGSRTVGGWDFRGRASVALMQLLKGHPEITLVFQKEGDLLPQEWKEGNRQAATLTGQAVASGSGDNKQEQSQVQAKAGQEEIKYDPLISIKLGRTTLDDAFNAIVKTAGLQAALQGNGTVVVGRLLPGELFGATSRTVRLNQVKPIDAAVFLNRLGASVTVFYLTGSSGSLSSSLGGSKEVVEARDQRAAQQDRLTKDYYDLVPISKILSPPNEPGLSYPLRGVNISADSRLGQITIAGPLGPVNLALSYLEQLDIRRRQVQVNVKVIDLNLDDLNSMNTSFSFRVGDTFVTNSNGVLGVNLGGSVPTLTTMPETDQPRDAQLKPPSVYPNPAIPAAPYLLQSNFLAALQAAVTNRSAKVLTDPTLVIQEGESSTVRITEKIVSYLNCQTTGSTGNTAIATVTPVLDDVGLKLGVQVGKIDDNGFVTVQVTPDLSAPVRQEDLGPCVAGGARQVVTLTQNRVTNSGSVRLRDGQTLVLSGVIQDFQRTQAVKFPLLGDLPIFGALFRSTQDTRERREIVVVLTPRIVDDTDLARFGYNTSQMLQR